MAQEYKDHSNYFGFCFKGIITSKTETILFWTENLFYAHPCLPQCPYSIIFGAGICIVREQLQHRNIYNCPFCCHSFLNMKESSCLSHTKNVFISISCTMHTLLSYSIYLYVLKSSLKNYPRFVFPQNIS